MKLSEAIKKLDEEVTLMAGSRDQDYHDAISLAIGCLYFRLKMKEQWCWSLFDKLDNEQPES